ncbi:NAD(P)-dependent oxidoreductase [Streptomyces sp. NPDC051976]|uniref:NAD-dependent epimerase/dehydratase family protein n=1 Tax=Streptomyces sp. NPDC051976 TaxID=3154947 RepID=UPI0034217657
MTNNDTGTPAPQTVLLAGASGVLGVHVVRALTAAGHRVVSLGRGAANDVSADLRDREALLRAVEGRRIDVVVHAATALRKPPVMHRDMAATNALRTEGTRNLLAAARETGARRFVVESMVFGYGFGDHGQSALAENTTPFAPRGADAALERTIAAMRTKEELAFTADGIEGVSLRFGLFYGAGGTDALLPLLRRRALPVTPDHDRVLPWVDLADAADAVALAVDHGRAGQAYNIAGAQPLGFAAHVRLTAELFGLPRPLTVPRWALRPMGYVHTVLGSTMRVDSTLARTELGWKPAHDTVPDGLAALVRERAAAQSRSADTTSTASAQDRKSA